MHKRRARGSWQQRRLDAEIADCEVHLPGHALDSLQTKLHRKLWAGAGRKRAARDAMRFGAVCRIHGGASEELARSEARNAFFGAERASFHIRLCF